MKGKYIELGNAKEGRGKVRNRFWEKGKVDNPSGQMEENVR